MKRNPARTTGKARLLGALLLTASLLVPACGARDVGRDEPFALLYSTLGYPDRGSKRALVRGLVPAGARSVDVERSRWSLVGPDGEVRSDGSLRALGTTFGAPLWEIDFSEWTGPGAGFRIRIRIESDDADGVAAPPIQLESLPFPIEADLYSRRLARGLSIHNAELRRAPASMGGGYFDCNSQMGEATSHAMFAAGLIELHQRRRDTLLPDERERLLAEIHRAIDYVLDLHDGASGEIANQHPSRPHGNPGVFNTQLGVYGLASYLALGAHADPARATAADRRVRTSLDYLARRGDLFPALGAAVYAHLHAYGGRPDDRDAGARFVDAQVAEFDPRTHFRHPQGSIPWFEGLARLAPAVDEPRRARWIAWARRTARALVSAAARNGYGVVPPLGEAAWDDPARIPVSPVEHAFFTNTYFLTRTLDAVWLGELLGDGRLEPLAASGVQWVGGVNPGFPAAFVTHPEASAHEPRVVAASFVVNGPGRHARPWRRWWWQGFDAAPRALTTTNGFLAPEGRGLVYDPAEWQPAETWMSNDGVLLRAAIRYEDFLRARPENAGTGPPLGR